MLPVVTVQAVPSHVPAKLLKPLGSSPQNGVKFFAAREVLELSKDDKWLHRATSAIHAHWREKNNRKTRAQGGETPQEATMV